MWWMALRPVLPLLLRRLVVALQGEIEDVLDLRAVVLSAFVRDKAVLVDLFQKVGRVELDFLVESGLGLGALLGLFQMAAWARWPRPWTLPVAGALVGYVTNWIAIKLLFEPAEPVTFGPIVLQGLFESRQPEVSDEFGTFMANRVVSSHQLLRAMASGGDDSKLYAFLRRQLPWPIPTRVLSAAVEAVRDCAAHPESHPALHTYMTDRLDVEETLSSRLKLLSPMDFEDLLHPVFQEDEVTLITVGGVLGAVAGLAQTRMGWGGPGATVRAAATIAAVCGSSAAYYLFEKQPIKEKEEVAMRPETMEVPKPLLLRRRNSLVRVDLQN